MNRVLDARYGAPDIRIHGGILKSEIAVGIHRAVFKHQILCIAKRLSALDSAVDELQALGVPAKEFAVDFRVVHRDVLRIPKGVFGVNLGVADHHIAAVLESIVAVMNIVGDINVGRMHEEIIGMIGRHVPEFDIAAVPKRFHRVGEFYLLEVDIFHVAEHLRRVDSGVLHAHIVGVPDGGAGAGRKAAALEHHMFGVPEGVFAFKEAFSGSDVFDVL